MSVPKQNSRILISAFLYFFTFLFLFFCLPVLSPALAQTALAPHATSYCNNSTTIIPHRGSATNTISVSGLVGDIGDIHIRLNNFSYAPQAGYARAIVTSPHGHTYSLFGFFPTTLSYSQFTNRSWGYASKASFSAGSSPTDDMLYGHRLGFSNFIGTNPNGTWTITLSDNPSSIAGSSGTLGGWCIDITPVSTITPVYNLCNNTQMRNGPVNMSPPSCTPNLCPYPSQINVSGVIGKVTDISVKMHGVTTAYQDSLDTLLYAPDGRKSYIMSDAGQGYNVPLTLYFHDSYPPLPFGHPIDSNLYYKPVNFNGFGSDLFTGSVGPNSLYNSQAGSELSIFNGINPNGTWKLFAQTNPSGPSGAYNTINGWCLNIETDNIPIETPVYSACSQPVTWGSNAKANPYPSEIDITRNIRITKVMVSINNFSSSVINRLDMLLASPDNKNLIIMSDTQPDLSESNVSFKFYDEAPEFLQTGVGATRKIITDVNPGNYKPTNVNFGSDDQFPQPAPAPQQSDKTLGVFNNSDAYGKWKMYIVSDYSPSTLHSGSMSNWCINFWGEEFVPTNTPTPTATNTPTATQTPTATSTPTPTPDIASAITGNFWQAQQGNLTKRLPATLANPLNVESVSVSIIRTPSNCLSISCSEDDVAYSCQITNSFACTSFLAQDMSINGTIPSSPVDIRPYYEDAVSIVPIVPPINPAYTIDLDYVYKGGPWIKLKHTGFTRYPGGVTLVNNMPYIVDSFDSDDSGGRGMIDESLFSNTAGVVADSNSINSQSSLVDLMPLNAASSVNNFRIESAYALGRDVIFVSDNIKYHIGKLLNSKAISTATLDGSNNLVLTPGFIYVINSASLDINEITFYPAVSSLPTLLVVTNGADYGNATINTNLNINLDANNNPNPLMIIANNITLGSTVAEANAIFVAMDKFNTSNFADTPETLKIRGNLLALGGINQNRKRPDSDNAKPTVFIIHDVVMYMKMLGMVSINEVRW